MDAKGQWSILYPNSEKKLFVQTLSKANSKLNVRVDKEIFRHTWTHKIITVLVFQAV